ncbi:MAG: hypothetical protein ACOC44_00505 [Promethearchaeia archaeon]
MDDSKHDLKKALEEERQIKRASKDINECDEQERENLREILKEGLL